MVPRYVELQNDNEQLRTWQPRVAGIVPGSRKSPKSHDPEKVRRTQQILAETGGDPDLVAAVIMDFGGTD